MKEKTLKEIISDIKIFGDTSNSKKYKKLIAEALLKLPINIRKKVLKEVFFIITDGYAGTIFKLRVCKPKTLTFIIIDFNTQKNESKNLIISGIAHEIAHFILKHDTENSSLNDEKEADDLCESWGFKRVYQDYKHY
jgi:hypothetical protein